MNISRLQHPNTPNFIFGKIFHIFINVSATLRPIEDQGPLQNAIPEKSSIIKLFSSSKPFISTDTRSMLLSNFDLYKTAFLSKIYNTCIKLVAASTGRYLPFSKLRPLPNKTQ